MELLSLESKEIQSFPDDLENISLNSLVDREGFQAGQHVRRRRVGLSGDFDTWVAAFGKSARGKEEKTSTSHQTRNHAKGGGKGRNLGQTTSLPIFRHILIMTGWKIDSK